MRVLLFLLATTLSSSALVSLQLTVFNLMDSATVNGNRTGFTLNNTSDSASLTDFVIAIPEASENGQTAQHFFDGAINFSGDAVGASVSDSNVFDQSGGQSLSFSFTSFSAGDTFTFEADIDYGPDPLASPDDDWRIILEGASMTATFSDASMLVATLNPNLTAPSMTVSVPEVSHTAFAIGIVVVFSVCLRRRINVESC